MSCKAIQYSDQMVCATCDLAWDTNDSDPPACRLPTGSYEIGVMFVDEAEMAGTVDLRPGVVNYALQKDRDNPPVYVSRDWQDMTLVDFCEGVGIKLGPWQRQFLEELDTQRGLQNKS